MSEIKHTPEPWLYEQGQGKHEGKIVITSFTMSASSPLAHISNICDDAEPDARRIVACVNYCAGLQDDDMIMATESGNGAAETIKALTDRCDELLSALKTARDYVYEIQQEKAAAYGERLLHKQKEISDDLRQVDAAIAKCEGK